MTYIYDILLNFNENLIEYFQWEESDKIKYVKKIALFKVESKVLKEIIDNEIIFDTDFTNQISKYEMNNLKETGKIFLLTDGLITIGILINNNTLLFSRLLLDEELETLETSETLPISKINYQIIKQRKKENNYLTRKEQNIKQKLINEIEKLYHSKNLDKLMYLYYEFTNKESRNIDYIYNYLRNSFKNFDKKHLNLFKILLLSSPNCD